jgi:benzylsuccinate CoA-transferase BbsE subunit
MREAGAELGALAVLDWKSWDATKTSQAEVDAIEAPVMAFFACLTKREFLIEAHRREMLGYPVATVADIASDPQLEARGFFQTAPGSSERFCGSFAVIDGERPPLRHAPAASFPREPSSAGASNIAVARVVAAPERAATLAAATAFASTRRERAGGQP